MPTTGGRGAGSPRPDGDAGVMMAARGSVGGLRLRPIVAFILVCRQRWRLGGLAAPGLWQGDRQGEGGRAGAIVRL